MKTPLPVLCLFALTAFADDSVSIVSVEPTQTQVILRYTTTYAGPCAWEASEGHQIGAPVNDVNATLFAGSNLDIRPGANNQVSPRYFVLGTRTAEQPAVDGAFRSRALAADTDHVARVTCGTATGTVQFHTLNPPLGNLYPELPPYNANAPWNVAYPTVDWTDQTRRYIDPRTGLRFWRLTGPSRDGYADPTSDAIWGPAAFGTPVLDVAGSGKWSSLSNLGTNGVSFARVSGGPADAAFAPLPQVDPAQGIHFDNFANQWILTNVRVSIKCGGATKDGHITVALSTDSGQTAGSATSYSVNCPSGAPAAFTYPSEFPNSYFAGWGTAFKQPDVGIPHGSPRAEFAATVADSVMTVANPVQPGLGFFNPRWSPGTKLVIDGTCCYSVASVQSSSQLTLNEPLTDKNNVGWYAAAFGVRVSKDVADGGSVDVSLGYSYALQHSVDPGPSSDASGMMFAANAVTVAKKADGSPLSPPLAGYLYFVDYNNSIYLWIPYNADGSVRAESRLISKLQLQDASHIDQQGDAIALGAQFYGSETMFQADGRTGAVTYATARLLKGTYTDSLNSGFCAGFPALPAVLAQPGAKGDCFQWTNLTPVSAVPSRDFKTQIANAYRSGKNFAGETVGPAHPSFDLSYWTTNQYIQTESGFTYVTLCPGNCDGAYTINAQIDVNTGKVVRVDDTWSVYPLRFARMHGAHTVQQWRNMSGFTHLCTPSDCSDKGVPSLPLNNDYRLPVVQVSRTDYGQTPVFSDNTSIDGADLYGCPHISDGVDPRWGVWVPDDKKCILVKTGSDACGHTPQLTYVFQDGKAGEQNEFPCPGHPNWTMLQPLNEGDWLIQASPDVTTELFVVLKKTVNSDHDIDLWLLRMASTNVLSNFYGLTNAATTDSPAHVTHTGPWALGTAVPFSTGVFIAYFKATEPAYTWYPANFSFGYFHGASEFDSQDRMTLLTFVTTYASIVGQPAVTSLLSNATEFTAINPAFARSTVTRSAELQGYPALWKPNAAGSEKTKAVDFRHYNPSYGAGAEYPFAAVGRRTFTKIPGTRQIYLQSGPGAGAGFDYKRIPLFGVDGPYLMPDLSNPAIGDTLPDTGFGFCYAYNDGECRSTSSAGDVYFSAPFVDTTIGTNACVTNSWAVTSPCVASLHPVGASIVEMDLSTVDLTAQNTRKLGMAWNIPLRQYQFSNWRFSPNGDFLIGTGQHVDGVLNTFLAMKLPSWPDPEPAFIDRSTFVQIPITLTGNVGDQVRIAFGYAENGKPSNLYCTARKEKCWTSADATTENPYVFDGEAQSRQACDTDCRIAIPAIPGRTVYYQVERTNGSDVSVEPLQAVAVP